MTNNIEVNEGKINKIISWNAIICGALIAFGLTFLFHLLTIGIGLSIFNTNQASMINLALGGFLWATIGGGLILFASGWQTGKILSMCPYHYQYINLSKCKCSNSLTHGFLAWILYLILSLTFGLLISEVSTVSFFKDTFINLLLYHDQPRDLNTVDNYKNIGFDVLVIYFIFSIGAISCSIGSYLGMKSRPYE